MPLSNPVYFCAMSSLDKKVSSDGECQNYLSAVQLNSSGRKERIEELSSPLVGVSSLLLVATNDTKAVKNRASSFFLDTLLSRQSPSAVEKSAKAEEYPALFHNFLNVTERREEQVDSLLFHNFLNVTERREEQSAFPVLLDKTITGESASSIANLKSKSAAVAPQEAHPVLLSEKRKNSTSQSLLQAPSYISEKASTPQLQSLQKIIVQGASEKASTPQLQSLQKIIVQGASEKASTPQLQSLQKIIVQGASEKATYQTAQQGSSLALSNDGLTLAIGGPQHQLGVGGSWIFTRSRISDDWQQQGNVLLGSGAIGASQQGSQLSLSADGNRLAVAGPQDNNGAGAVWLFERITGSWYEMTRKLTISDQQSAAHYGASLALSSNGLYLAVGAPNDSLQASSANQTLGSTTIYYYSNNRWLPQATIRAVAGNACKTRQASSLALSVEGDCLIIGCYRQALRLGQVLCYRRSEQFWKLEACDVFSKARHYLNAQGRNVTLSGDGNTLAIGGFSYVERCGATWIYRYLAGSWNFSSLLLLGREMIEELFEAGDEEYYLLRAGEEKGQSLLLRGQEEEIERRAEEKGELLTVREEEKKVVTRALLSPPLLLTIEEIETRAEAKEHLLLVREEEIETRAEMKGQSLSSREKKNIEKGQSLSSREQPKKATVKMTERKIYSITQSNYSPNAIHNPSLSHDGRKIAISGCTQEKEVALWLYSREDDHNWSAVNSFKQSALLQPPIPYYPSRVALALSGDACSIVIGAPQLNNANGGVYPLIAQNAGLDNWRLQELINAPSYLARPSQGSTIALSSDGLVLAIAGPNDQDGIGAVWIFTRAAAGDSKNPITSQWQQQGSKLESQGLIGKAAQGSSLSLSSNGNRLLVGCPGDNNGVGCVLVYLRYNTSNWGQSGPKLLANDLQGSGAFGSSICLSGDGRSFVTSAPSDDNGRGAVLFFSEKSAVWSQVGSKIVHERAVIGVRNAIVEREQLVGVSGGCQSNESKKGSKQDDKRIQNHSNSNENNESNEDSKRIQNHSNSNENNESSKSNYNGKENSNSTENIFNIESINPSPARSYPNIGAVAISSNGQTIAVGCPGEENGIGAVRLYSRGSNSNSWILDPVKLVANDYLGKSEQGSALSFSADGKTLAIGGPGDRDNQGSVWIFDKSENGAWHQLLASLSGTAAKGAARQGTALALSANGEWLLIGGAQDGNDGSSEALISGASWLFCRQFTHNEAGREWMQNGDKLVGTYLTGNAGCGMSVALSGDGEILSFGGGGDNQGVGAVWIGRR